MSKICKVLSVLLAMILLFSTASIGVEAAYSAYKDNAITRYDSIDKPVLTPAQYASMAMDEVDRMLAEENMKIKYDLAGLITIEADFTSVDKALGSIADVYGSVKSLLPTIGGDIARIDFSAIVGDSGLNCPKRTTAGKTDADIFLALLEFLADNASIIAKVPKGSAENGGLDLGILSGFVNLGDKLNVPAMAKEALAKLVWPDKTADQLNLNLTVDQYVQTFINDVADGTYATYKKGIGTIVRGSTLIAKYLPGLTDRIDLLNDSVYTLINNGVKIALNEVAIPFANPRLQAAIRRLCGYDYYKTKDADGDTIWLPNSKENPNWDKELNGLENVFNVNFNLAPFPVDTWGDDWIVDHLNDILGQIVRAAINPNLTYTWKTAGGNANLMENIINVAKLVLSNTGDAFFASYVEVLTPAEMNALSDDQFVAYILRSILNASISDVFIPNTCDTTLEVLFELVKSIAANFVPSRNYASLDASLDSIIEIGLDMAAYGLNGITNMDLDYGMDAEEFADEAFDWVETNYGGFVSEIDGDSGWQKLSYVIFQIIPANWLSLRDDNSERDDIYDLLFTDIVENILNFDLDAVLKLLDQNEDGELNGTIIQVLLARLTAIVNYILPDVFPDQEYNTLEGLLDTGLLSTIIENLLNTLYDRASDGMLDAALPVVCAVLGLSSAETFGYPYISLEDQHNAGEALLTSFYMYNGSSGINTNATDKNGRKTQDKLYRYQILSVETNNDAITVSPSGGISINGGTSQTFNFVGDLADADETVLKVTITYDVYSEKNTKMTPNPLTATTYTYIYNATTITPDNEKAKADADNKNLHLVYYKPTTYLSADSKMGDLADYSMDLQRNKSKDSSAHNANATWSVTNINVDGNLAAAGVTANKTFTANTNNKGGVVEYDPYVVSNKDATVPEGNYTNNFFLKATKSDSAGNDESISFTHNIFVYDDFDLGSLLNGAVRSDRQQANYGTGNYDVSYPVFGSDPEDEDPELYEDTVNGADAWDRYVEAVDVAAAIVYAPRQVSTMQSFVDNGEFESAAMELYAATKELDACSVSGGTAGIKAAIDSIVPPDIESVDENGEEVHYEYDDPRHTFFGRADYINYTYGNFKSERRAAERVLDAEKEAIKKGEEYQIEAIRAAYLAHRVSLYGERLVRVRAYKTHLNKAIQDYTALYNAGQGTYSSKTWNNFTRAYDFAVSVNNEAIGSVISGTENLQNEGLRQSKVNEARSQLIKTAKKLEEAKPMVDYTQLSAQIAAAKATYDAGISNYTELSWNTFTAAYDAAVALVAEELELSDANQTRVNNAYTALKNAYEALEEIVDEGDWNFADYTVLSTMTSEMVEMQYIVGLDEWDPVVSDYVETTGGYTINVELNSEYMESTGAVATIYDGNGNVIGTYDIVMYGDVTGDGIFNGADTVELLKGIGYATPWAAEIFFTDENAYAMAADMDHNCQLDGNDVSVMMKQQGYTFFINQAWMETGDMLWTDEVGNEYY